jgi:lysozyme
MSKRARNALIGATGVVALSITVLIQPWEGRENKAYRDIVGVWTICDGETKGVKPGMVKTDAECDAMLLRRVQNDFYAPVAKSSAATSTARDRSSQGRRPG